ncbi:MAG: carboxypeptidase regulatory-like domain-containing protein [Planctomycetes bacterium]|nr:carboxypeptidase regulatory-like domain-containing protein [Planctomycetota bacterium]
MKPALVLILVLAAIGALFFTLSRKSDKPQPVELPPISSPETPTDPKTATNLTQPVKAVDRTVQNTKPVTPGAVGQANPIHFDNKVTGLIKNDKNEPISGAEVTLTKFQTGELMFLNDPRPDPLSEPRVLSDSDGRYTFLGIEPRTTYGIIVTHPNYAQARENSMPIGESGTVEQAPIILTSGGTLSGYVSDEAGNRITDATLHLDGENYLQIGDAPPDRLTTTTNKEGWYAFANVPSGPRTVGVSAPGYGKIQVGGFVFNKQEMYARDFTLKISEMISGRVIGSNNEPVPDANVIAVAVSHAQQSGPMQVKTNAKGEFLMENLVPGDYNVIANCAGWRMVQGRNNTRIKSNTANVVIEMMKEASVCGVVIDGGTGAPVTNFAVRLRFWYGEGNPTAAHSAELMQVTNDKGEFCIQSSGPSDYVVEASAPGFAPSLSPNFTVQLGQPVNGIVVKLGRGGSITGRVVDPDGKPVARARVMTQDNTWTDDEFTRAIGPQFPTNATTVEVRTDDAGRFVCSGLNPEIYQLVITADGFTPFNRTGLRVTEGGVMQAGDLKMLRGGSVRGTLFDASGKPVSGGTIRLRAIDGIQYVNMATKTGGDGKFVLSNAPAGRYQLSGMRANRAAGNPFEELIDSNGSQMNVIVAEGDVTTQDLRLQD